MRNTMTTVVTGDLGAAYAVKARSLSPVTPLRATGGVRPRFGGIAPTTFPPGLTLTS